MFFFNAVTHNQCFRFRARNLYAIFWPKLLKLLTQANFVANSADFFHLSLFSPGHIYSLRRLPRSKLPLTEFRPIWPGFEIELGTEFMERNLHRPIQRHWNRTIKSRWDVILILRCLQEWCKVLMDQKGPRWVNQSTWTQKLYFWVSDRHTCAFKKLQSDHEWMRRWQFMSRLHYLPTAELLTDTDWQAKASKQMHSDNSKR